MEIKLKILNSGIILKTFTHALYGPRRDKTCLRSFQQSEAQTKPDVLSVPDLGSNCLQRLSADDSSRQRVKQLYMDKLNKVSPKQVISH